MGRKLGGLVVACMIWHVAFADEPCAKKDLKCQSDREMAQMYADEAAKRAQHPCDGVNYTVERSVDPITDEQKCMVSNRLAGGGAILATVNGKEGLKLMLTGEADPGNETITIRVDKNKPHDRDSVFSGDDATAILSELRKGTEVSTRYTPWPEGGNNDRKFQVCNLPAMIDQCLGAESPKPTKP
jgi:hypothetical protein